MSRSLHLLHLFLFFFFNDTATTEIYTLPLHDALPILEPVQHVNGARSRGRGANTQLARELRVSARRHSCCFFVPQDRKSTRLNSSHVEISYAVFCLKKKKKQRT